MLESMKVSTAPDAPFDRTLHRALLEYAGSAGSDLLLLPVQDVFGWPDRINVPATVGEHNWTWKLPLSVDGLRTDPTALDAADRLRAVLSESGRL